MNNLNRMVDKCVDRIARRKLQLAAAKTEAERKRLRDTIELLRSVGVWAMTRRGHEDAPPLEAATRTSGAAGFPGAG